MHIPAASPQSSHGVSQTCVFRIAATVHPNPGRGTCAAVGYFQGEQHLIIRHFQLTGINAALYGAAIACIEWALTRGATSVEIRTDSEIIVRQVNGACQVKDPGLAHLLKQIKELARRLSQFNLMHVETTEVKRAKRVAREEHAAWVHPLPWKSV